MAKDKKENHGDEDSEVLDNKFEESSEPSKGMEESGKVELSQ
ncbi:MAG: hypothetical protein VX426_03445 [Chloroflexota bacterium]|nr:hypothetical protein [Chloroflexota bacterium]